MDQINSQIKKKRCLELGWMQLISFNEEEGADI